MLDVHPPHEPVHGIRDFLLHLFTITVGLLIALGLEAAVEWRHHVHLRDEAEDNIRREIRDNQTDLRGVLANIPKEQQDFNALVPFLQRRAAGQPAEIKSISVNLHLMTPQDASWQTAGATGALAYMPYSEVQKFAAVYQLQKKLDGVQDTTLQPVISLIGLVGAADPEKMGDPEQLGKEDSQIALTQVREVMAHVEAMRELAVDLSKHYDEALKER